MKINVVSFGVPADWIYISTRGLICGLTEPGDVIVAHHWTFLTPTGLVHVKAKAGGALRCYHIPLLGL